MSTSARGPGIRGLAVHFGALILVLSLLSSGVITWISVRGIERFLENQIERDFPEQLENARKRLEVWYAQRELDLASFARSEILGEAMQAAPERGAGRDEIASYLGYVLGRFPQYAGLVLLDGEGEAWVQVGMPAELPAALRSSVRRLERPSVSPILELDGDRFQLVSSPVIGSAATLHGLLRVSALGDVLSVELGPHAAALAVLDADGRPVAGAAPEGLDGIGADRQGRPVLLEHQGQRSIASVLAFERFGWRVVIHEAYDVAFAPARRAVRRAWIGNLLVVGAAGLLAFALGAWRARPILALAEGARRLAAGETDVEVPVTRGGDEVQLLGQTFNEMAARLAANRLELESRNQELQAANEVLEQLSITDGLTKLHNHRYFQDQFEREARRADRTGEPLALILVDLDDFKKLNDGLGHATGDAMLALVAERMSDSVRSTDILTRYGGEEFAVLAPATPSDGALALAEKTRCAIAAGVLQVAGEPVSTTASLGVALYDGDRARTFERADRALYAAKQSGKNCTRVAEAAPDA